MILRHFRKRMRIGFNFWHSYCLNLYVAMRNLKLIGLIFLLCFSSVIKADNFSDNQNKGSLEATSIYPNPVSNGENLTIKGDKELERIEIINIVGKRVIEEKVSPTTVYELNINGFDKGIYLIKIHYTDNNSIIERIWVK